MRLRTRIAYLVLALLFLGLSAPAVLAQEDVTVKPKGTHPGGPPTEPPPPHSHKGLGGFKWSYENGPLKASVKNGKFRDDLLNQLCRLDVVERDGNGKITAIIPATKVVFKMGDDEVFTVTKQKDGKYKWDIPVHPQKPCLGRDDKECQDENGHFSGVPPELMNADGMYEGSIMAWLVGSENGIAAREIHMKGVECDQPVAPAKK